ncbi:MAG: metallophosphoesterase family protein, partial [Bacteroidota bacterium]
HFYQNGVRRMSQPIDLTPPSTNQSLRICSYLANEPYMEVANLVKRLRVYNKALTKEELLEQKKILETEVERGIRYPDQFHFTAGPYLHNLTSEGVNISWESDRPAKNARIYYGSKLPLNKFDEVSFAATPDLGINTIQVHSLAGLPADQPYFYEVQLTSPSGETIQSGVLTFKTGPDAPRPFSFAVLGDTEARPHVNHQLAKLIWDERPEFLLNLGDLTDGGKAPHKFEWNLEYFLGMDALTSRIPIFAVPGNGEGDLYWYERYHRYPDLGDAYTFSYGDAAFFMLNSNQKAEFAPGGRQYTWLEEQLKTCDAKWKIVCHHHAPYSGDENDYGDSWTGPSAMGDTLVRRIVPLYEQYNIDLVFFGHLHTYQRTLPIREGKINRNNGIVYVQGGGGGGNLEDFAPTRAWFSGKTYRGHHYFTVDVDSERVHLRMYDAKGQLKDFLDLEKEE